MELIPLFLLSSLVPEMDEATEVKECKSSFKTFATHLCLNMYIIFTFVIHSLQTLCVLNTFHTLEVMED